MGRRANPTLIGVFIVGAVALIVVGLLVFGRGQFFTETRTFVLFFDGSVKGLNVGAPVDFQGVKIGSVTDIVAVYVPQENVFRTPVYIQIEAGSIKEFGVRGGEVDRRKFFQMLLERGLRARLETQSLVTGQLFVQLGFYPDTPIRLVGGDPDTPEFPTIPTTLQQAQAAAQDFLEKLKELPLDQLFAQFMEVVQGTSRLVNSPEVPALLRTLNDTMTDVRRLVQHDGGQVGRVLNEMQGASTATRLLLADLQQLVRRLDGQIVPLTDGTKQTLEAARAALKDAQQLVRNADSGVTRMANSFSDTAKAAQATMITAQRRLDDNLVVALQELASAMRSFRVLADYLERNPNAILYGKGGDRR
ncbi:MAG TPA: MlaD family protein [Candidatus Tectomicrobia bacterium]|nr:MlaD family protein [Candidatus Tectomicrobia bacterium]